MIDDLPLAQCDACGQRRPCVEGGHHTHLVRHAELCHVCRSADACEACDELAATETVLRDASREAWP